MQSFSNVYKAGKKHKEQGEWLYSTRGFLVYLSIYQINYVHVPLEGYWNGIKTTQQR